MIFFPLPTNMLQSNNFWGTVLSQEHSHYWGEGEVEQHMMVSFLGWDHRAAPSDGNLEASTLLSNHSSGTHWNMCCRESVSIGSFQTPFSSDLLLPADR